jgi:two-component system NtrC family sensor kinase
MSLRTALLLAMLGVVALSGVALGALGVARIDEGVYREAQSRVDHDLDVISSQFYRQLELLAGRLQSEARGLRVSDDGLAERLHRIKRNLGLTLVNLCDDNGRAVAGSYASTSAVVPVERDSVVRKALEGTPAWGTMRLDSDRLRLEGGPALQTAMTVRDRSGTILTTEALFEWAAIPLFGDDARVVAVLYGGRAINFNYDMVDSLRDLAFSRETHRGKPLGTVTVFLDGIRVATNVLGPEQNRAVGTRVSEEVERQVLEQGRSWSDRAWVVDAWYLSGYEPLRNPDGEILGMLYVGLLEAPYAEMRAQLVLQFVLLVVLVSAITLAGALVLVGRITHPLEGLSKASQQMAVGRWDEPLERSTTYSEIDDLTEAFRGMQKAIGERDARLRSQNAELAETNENLQTTNRNYMKMLSFITHELRSPIGTIQTMVEALTQGLLGELPADAKRSLVRIGRNCEEMQDMIRDYLDLSRAERGELTLNRSEIDFRQEVIEPCATQVEPLLASRHMKLTTDCAHGMRVAVDEELMRIALGNYLSNAAKYGREEAAVQLAVRATEQNVEVSVRNEGPGFSEADRGRLFQKFSRLRNPHTSDKRGSGLGLFLCRRILELHGGEVWAESEEGHWAAFCFSFPRNKDAGKRNVEKGTSDFLNESI